MAEATTKTDTKFTIEEVGKHKTEKDCWIVVNGKVLDITPFLSLHPGGDDILLDGAGKDLSSDFEDTGHSTDARKQMEKYVVGVLDGAKEAKSASEKATSGTVSASGNVNPAVLVAILIAIVAALFLLLNP